MLIPANTAQPGLTASLEARFYLPQPALEIALQRKLVLFNASPGYLSTDRLAALLLSKGSLIWLRASPLDHDPASLYISLLYQLSSSYPEVASQALQRLRRRPGPIYGWAQHFSGLANAMVEAKAAPASFVIEHADVWQNSPENSENLFSHFLPLLPEVTCAITSHQNPLRFSLPIQMRRAGERELRLEEADAWKLAAHYQVSLPAGTLRQLLHWSGGNEGLLAGVFAAGQLLGSAAVQQAFASPANLASALSRLIRDWLNAAPEEAAGLLNLALQMEYLHSDMFLPVTKRDSAGPFGLPNEWLQPLGGGWLRLHCAWRGPIRQALEPHAGRGASAAFPQAENPAWFESALVFLLHQGHYEQAIPLLLEYGLFNEAARTIVQVVNVLLDRGQWNTLAAWLARLPAEVRQEWPWLVYAEGEINAAGRSAHLHGTGRTWQDAEQHYSTAARRFLERRDLVGACMSLLTHSCLAAWQNDTKKARALARQAQETAAAAGQPWHLGWADWQLACLAFADGDLEAAQKHFSCALDSAQHAADTLMFELIDQARVLAGELADLRQQKEQHRRAYFETEQAEQRAALRLQALLEGPVEGAESLLSAYGWSKTPLQLKMFAPKAAEEVFAKHPGARESMPERIASRVRHLFRPRESEQAPGQLLTQALRMMGEWSPPGQLPDLALVPDPFHSPEMGLAASEADAESEAGAATSAAHLLPAGVQAGRASDQKTRPVGASPEPEPQPALFALPLTRPADDPAPAQPPQSAPGPAKAEDRQQDDRKLALHACMLGSLRISLNGEMIESWPSGRGRGVFSYLLAQRGEPVAREVIMEVFWPEANFEAARNNLNVVIHSLRRLLKTTWDYPIILHQNSAYRLNPAIDLSLDFVQFEQHAQAGRQMESEGETEQAIWEYEQALALYQGDFLADSLYEDWAAVVRERLRVLSLEILDHLSIIYFSKAQYDTSAELCHQILLRDNCREDAHYRLMRCYSRMGQPHQAIRQYQVCLDALREELDVAPSPAITQLYEKVRRRESV